MQEKIKMGKRAQQKAALKARIIEAATALFTEKGYKQTTVDEIAQEAGIAWATVYKYFKTKEDIVVAVITPGLNEIFEGGKSIISRPGGTPAKAMIRLLSGYMKWRDGWNDRRFQLELCTAGLIRDNEVLYESANRANNQTKEQIKELLVALTEQSSIRSNIDLDDLTVVIYSLFNQLYIHHITHESVTVLQTTNEMKRLITLLFKELHL